MTTSNTHPHFRILPTFILAAVLALGLGGCGGDDDGGPGDPGGQTTADEFDQAIAVAQSQSAASQAVALVSSMAGLAGGLNKSADNDWSYGWNVETQRWEWIYEYSGDGYQYDWFYTVQYLNSDGDPQQNASGATSISHDMTGTGSYHYAYENTVVDYTMDYDYASMIAGLGSATLVLTGNGGYDLDYTYQSPDGNFSASYVISWETVAPGITMPGLDGCPTGTIRYDFPPFYSLVVFDGSDTAVTTLYNANGSVVPGGGGTFDMYCGAIEGR